MTWLFGYVLGFVVGMSLTVGVHSIIHRKPRILVASVTVAALAVLSMFLVS